MLSIMFRNKSVNNYFEVPEQFIVQVDQVTEGTLQISVQNPFTSEGYNYYSDEVAYVMNSKGSTISTHTVK